MAWVKRPHLPRCELYEIATSREWLPHTGRVESTGMPLDLHPRGVIVDTHSKGRFDLVIFADGILAIHGSYVGVGLIGAGAGMVGAGGSAAGSAAAAGLGLALGASGADRYEAARVSKALRAGRAEALSADPRNHFIAGEGLQELRLKKRWYGHSLAVVTPIWPGGRVYGWKPALNRLPDVKELLLGTWPHLVKLV